jgi:hypothetical protein
MYFVLILGGSWHVNFDCGMFHLPDLEIGLKADVTGRQWIFTPPSHLIPPMVHIGVCVCPVLFCIFYTIYEIGDCSYATLLDYTLFPPNRSWCIKKKHQWMTWKSFINEIKKFAFSCKYFVLCTCYWLYLLSYIVRFVTVMSWVQTV